MGIPIQELQREDPIRDKLLEVDGLPWPKAYSNWVENQIRLFYKTCHGHVMEAPCCKGAIYDGRFDSWLELTYSPDLGEGEEEFCLELLGWAQRMKEVSEDESDEDR